ncbi:MAG: glycosyltransferase [Saprospiraceae bacterium]|nr:MAG: group 1 glycosyl transferase [Bacteroidetes bacterium OLB9]MCO6464881.1 glycosyltransferase [Saprospiraceae bacterium]
MKILQLCKKFPFPLKDGESIAVTYLSKALHELGCEISLLSMNTTKHFVDISRLPDDFNHYKEIHVTELDNSVNAIDAFKNLFSSESYHVSRFVCPDFKNKLIELLKSNQYDVVQLETLYLAPYIEVIKEHSDAIVAMRAHNVEFEIWERITTNTKFILKKWYLKYLTNKLKRYELDHLNMYDYLIAVSERDLRKFKSLGYKNGAMSSPIGLDLRNYKNRFTTQISDDLCFIGALDWIPNMEGLTWFLDHVWPELSKMYPELKFHIAGRNTPESLKNINIKNVIVHGEVSDAVEFVSKYSMMIVPLFSGSGMRVKILEGMALGRVVITTTLGKEGISAEDGTHILEANNAAEFLYQISSVLKGDRNKNAIGMAARAFVEDHYDHNTIAIKLLNKYKSLKSNPNYKKPAHML